MSRSAVTLPALLGGRTAEQLPGEIREPAGPPKPGGETERQDTRVTVWGTDFAPNGGAINNPCGFPSYGSLYTGTYATYRFMLRHPRIAHARRQVEAPILSNSWGLQVRKGTPDNVKQFIEDAFPAGVIRRWKRDAFRALDYGWYPFEKVWAAREGRWWVDWLKPLTVDANGIVVTKAGRFAGVRYKPGDSGILEPRDCVCHTHDGEAGDLYGRPRLENVRETAWREWLDAANQMQLTRLKIAGKLAIIFTPSGTYVDGNGNTKSWRDTAMAAGKAIADVRSNGTVWLPGMKTPDMLSKENIEYAKMSLVTIDVKDFGNHSEAIGGFLKCLQAAEQLMFAGYLRSARTGMESEHGSRADAEEHTNTDTSDIELVESDMADTFNAQVVDDLLEVNFGPDMRGAVYYEPAKLTDENRATDDKIVDAILKNPETATPALAKVDKTTVARRRGIPIKNDGEWDFEGSVGNGADRGDEPPPDDEPDEGDDRDDE